MFRICPIASGSSGNCTYVEAGNQQYLIDAGISGKRIVAGLENLGVNPARIQGIFITHEHSDHIKGAGIFSRKFNTPIYATQKTWSSMNIGQVASENSRIIEKERFLELDDLLILPYSIEHDAIDPVSYVLEYQDKKIAMATDLGRVSQSILKILSGVDGLLLESNHDVSMLEAGIYPYELKRRILGNKGHLNNEDAAKAIVKLYHPKLKWIVLGHLSLENNMPDLAYLTTKQALEKESIKVGKDVELCVAKRNDVTGSFEV